MRITGKVVLKTPTILFLRETALPPIHYSLVHRFDIAAALRTSCTLPHWKRGEQTANFASPGEAGPGAAGLRGAASAGGARRGADGTQRRGPGGARRRLPLAPSRSPSRPAHSTHPRLLVPPARAGGIPGWTAGAAEPGTARHGGHVAEPRGGGAAAGAAGECGALLCPGGLSVPGRCFAPGWSRGGTECGRRREVFPSRLGGLPKAGCVWMGILWELGKSHRLLLPESRWR